MGTFCSLLAFLLLHGYIKKSRRLAATGLKWGTLGSAVRYDIVSAALTSLAKTAAAEASFSFSKTQSMSEEGVSFSRGLHQSSSLSSAVNGSSLSDSNNCLGEEDVANDDEWIHFYPNPDFHAKNWRPQLLTIVDVDSYGTPKNLHVLSLAAQLQQIGRGINVVISVIDRSDAAAAALVASAVNSICAEKASVPSGASDFSSLTAAEQSVPMAFRVAHDRWCNEEDSLSTASSVIDHYDTIKLIRRSKALLLRHMKKEGMDGFAEVSSTNGNFFEAIWTAVIHTGLGPLSPNTILLSFPSFLVLKAGEEEGDQDVRNPSIPEEQNKLKAEEYISVIRGILKLGKAVILFKGSPTFPKKGNLLPGRGTIDIWWIVHDGGLLLLLPFLLSKHSLWASGINYCDKKKMATLRRQTRGARLRLFAVSTNVMENPEKLRKAVMDHLEQVRIHAEVTVVDCLARTNIADCMRDRMSGHVALISDVGFDISSIRNPSCQKNMELSSCNNYRLKSLREDGISTHHMTLGEVFSPEAYEKPCSSLAKDSNIACGERSSIPDDISLPRDITSVTLNNSQEKIDTSINDGHTQGIQTASMLNEAIKRHSSNSNLVVTNLPLIRNDQSAEDYFNFVGTVCKGIDNVMLVRGSGAEVITVYA